MDEIVVAIEILLISWLDAYALLFFTLISLILLVFPPVICGFLVWATMISLILPYLLDRLSNSLSSLASRDTISWLTSGTLLGTEAGELPWTSIFCDIC